MDSRLPSDADEVVENHGRLDRAHGRLDRAAEMRVVDRGHVAFWRIERDYRLVIRPSRSLRPARATKRRAAAGEQTEAGGRLLVP